MSVQARAAQRSYRQAFEAVAERVQLRRGSGASAQSVSVRVRIRDYQPDELVGDITQNHRRVIMLAEDATLTPPIQENDRLIVRGRPMIVEAIDDNTRRIGDTLLAYELRVKG